MPVACGIPRVVGLPRRSAPGGNRCGWPRPSGSMKEPPTRRWLPGSGSPGCRPTAGAVRWPKAADRRWRRREPVARRRLSPVQLDELQALRDAGPAAEGWADQCWTLPRIAAVVRERFGVDYT